MACLTLDARPIYTPPPDENEDRISIPAPSGWSVKHYKVTNGLKAVFWPLDTDPINAETMVFVFIGDKSNPVNKLENIEPFRYKCPAMALRKIPNLQSESENSLKRYFKGKCGRGMALVHIDEGYYSLIILMVSSQYLTTNDLKNLDAIAKSYRSVLVKAMGQDYYLMKEDVNNAVKDKFNQDFQVKAYDPITHQPTQVKGPIVEASPAVKTTPGDELSTSEAITVNNEKINDKTNINVRNETLKVKTEKDSTIIKEDSSATSSNDGNSMRVNG